MVKRCRQAPSSSSSSHNGIIFHRFAVTRIRLQMLQAKSILMHIEFISVHVSARYTVLYIEKPGYYVNIVCLKSCTLHNWLHTHTQNMHTQINTLSFFLSFPLSCHTDWQEHWNIVMFPPYTLSPIPPFTRWILIICVLRKIVAKMRIRLLYTFLHRFSHSYFCS